MILSELKTRFFTELNPIYTPSEITELFAIFTEKHLNFDKINLKINENHPISTENENLFLEIISELKIGKPYQQILSEAHFFGKIFLVDENVLIPRPETEELIELALNQLKNKNENIKILDIGSGSGCIPISLALHLPNAEITSIDISEKALKIAQKNNKIHQTKVNFVLKDYLNKNLEDTYDVIISNPPYIDLSEAIEISASVKDFEPHLALFAPQNDALAFYKKIAKDCEKHLNPKGFLFLEINQKLGQETLALFHHLTEKQLLKDLSGNDRFVIGRK